MLKYKIPQIVTLTRFGIGAKIAKGSKLIGMKCGLIVTSMLSNMV